MSIQWWGYRHTNGTKQIKRYFSQLDLDEAAESPFVAEIFGPVDADSREDAARKLFQKEDRENGTSKKLG